MIIPAAIGQFYHPHDYTPNGYGLGGQLNNNEAVNNNFMSSVN
jgi:hypothetical protein